MKKELLLISTITILCSISIVFASLDYTKVENLKLRKIDGSIQAKHKIYKTLGGIMNQTKNLRQYKVAGVSNSDL
ncbi:MAG: hypothetical protein A2381_04430 [Bdellovibrionales bacterium RIFOXYB1_FULL_37_110]|nr:MAG: hypothetical protein A2417_16010 [Bdellovibrionales bacterium RIFOXYC1_FULL_37_79]OFZ57414.1 MAG: hypothetical protein A2381_04430 [Bdellovibrionales bacterium RIFOXYB1_FULL_37_110]OFZ62266.1 MAG: hypothetical protein A2577_12950 [Bdellovibrionales bacterium RIFOXYD1_FULL_36_51]